MSVLCSDQSSVSDAIATKGDEFLGIDCINSSPIQFTSNNLNLPQSVY